MAGHTNNAALNEAARLEHERLRKDADKACTDYTAVYLSGFADGKAEQQARIAELEAENERLRDACIKQNFAIEQTLGRALGYVEPDGTVNVCEHTAETLAIEAARELAVRDRAMEILAECHNPVYCPFPEDEHTPCVKCTLKQYSKNYQKFRVDAALAQARAEMEGKLEAKP